MKMAWVPLCEEKNFPFFLKNKVESIEDKRQIDDLIKNYLIQKAKEEGKKEITEKLSKRIKKKVDNYIKIITEVVDDIYKYIKTHYKETDFKIIEERTDFNFNTFEIKILFIIDTSIENEMKFLSLLSDRQQKLLNGKKYFAEFLYINKRNCKTIDIDSVNLDFPFIRARK